jgi:hypothetical protein
MMSHESTRVFKVAFVFILLVFAVIGVRPMGMVAAESESLASPVATGVATNEPTAYDAVPTEDPTATEEPAATDVVVPTQPSQAPPRTVTPIATSTPEADILASPEATAPTEPEYVTSEKQTLTIHVTDEHGKPLTDDGTGACFYIPPALWDRVCDGFDGVNDGDVHASLQPGGYTVSQASAPEGYGPAAPVQVMILAGEPAEITVQDVARPILTVHKVDEHGNPLADNQGGACFELTSSEGYRVACDGDDGASDGEITLLGTVGTYTLTEVRAPLGYILPDSIDVTIVGGPNEITVANLPPESLTIHKVDEHDELLTDTGGGACFLISPGSASTVCDGDDGVNDGTITLLTTVGVHTFWETRAPEGYLLAAQQQITIVAGGQNEVTVEDLPAEIVTIHKVDENGNLLTDAERGACFSVGSDSASRACDSDDDTNDGMITLPAAPGVQTLYEDLPPRGYYRTEGRQITIVPGGPNEFTVEDKPLPTLTVFKVDENGNPATDTNTGACFEALLEDENICDSDDGSNDGAITLSLQPGWNYLTETRNPEGYGGWLYDEPVYVADGVHNEITVTNVKLQPVTVYKVDENGNALTGACFELWEPGDEVYVPDYRACDADDGANDGTIVFPNVLPTVWELMESRAPSGYATADTRDLKVVSGGPTRVTITDEPLQTVTVFLVDEHGDPLFTIDHFFPMCFLIEDSLDDKLDVEFYDSCDHFDGVIDGTIVFPEVPPGRYWLVQTDAIEGYAKAQPQQIDVVIDGLNEVTIVNVPTSGEPTAVPTQSPPGSSSETPAAESPGPTAVGGVLALPSTGAGDSAAGSAGGRVPILTGLIALVLLGGAARWRRRVRYRS